ncbi:hypothetical protein GCM10028818_15840 [Spirosoma horti]
MREIRWILFFLLVAEVGYGQQKTSAFFMVGNYATPNWEKLTFNTTKSDRGITYSYQKNEEGHKLDVLGTKNVGNQKVLMVKIRNTSRIYLILRDRKKETLSMVSEDGTYKKTFPLGYEGPVDGRGTYCATCANEPDDAFRLVNSFFL